MIERHELTDADVWTLLLAGCNAVEIAAWAGVSRAVAVAMMHRAARLYADVAEHRRAA